MKTCHRFYRVDKRKIGFLKYIFEAHDGICVVTTLDVGEGLVRFAIAPGCEEDVDRVVQDLKKEFSLHDV